MQIGHFNAGELQRGKLSVRLDENWRETTIIYSKERRMSSILNQIEKIGERKSGQNVVGTMCSNSMVSSENDEVGVKKALAKQKMSHSSREGKIKSSHRGE